MNIPLETIVCVDDDPDILEIYEEYLFGLYQVVLFWQPIDAFNYLKKNSCSLLLLDIFMEEMNGLEFIGKLGREGIINFPILVCTGGADSGLMVGRLAGETALELGADNVLLKPFEKNDLIKKIKSLVKL